MTDYGLTLAGFVPKGQAAVIAELRGRLRATFGNNVNLDDRSVFGQLVGVLSEPIALLWEALQAVYASQYPAGAEGVSVDNILALNNMRRLAATPSVTNPAIVPRGDGVTLYGLAVYGTPGTHVGKGSVVRDTSSPPASFTIDQDIVIQAPVDAQQAIVYSDLPDTGQYTLGLPSYRTGELLTGVVTADALADYARISFTGTIGGGQYYVMVEDKLLGPFNTTVGTPIQTALSAAAPWDSSTVYNEDDQPTHPIRMQLAPGPPVRPTFNPTQIDWSAGVSSGSYKLTVAGAFTTAAITSLNASDIQAAIRALGAPYDRAFVHSDTVAHKVWINWGVAGANPTVTVGSNTTGATPTVHASNTSGVTFTVVDSLHSVIAGLRDDDGVRPYSDVAVTSTTPNIFTVQFGAGAVASGAPSSGGRAVPKMQITANSLTVSGALVTPQVIQYAEGAAARGVGSATCTVTGPKAVAAGRLTVIGSPTDGWDSVNNDLDVIPGRDTETDLQALTRREDLLNAAATGPLDAIKANVKKVPGVTSATGFQNTTDAALQRVLMTGVPTTGTWQLRVPGVAAFTAPIASGAAAEDVQAALNAIGGLEQVLVNGDATDGFTVDFNGAMGSQAQPLLEVWNSTLDVGISVAWGRPPKSVEVLVLGGAPDAIARAIYEKLPAGVMAYGAPVRRTAAALTAGSAVVTVVDALGIEAGHAVVGLGIPQAASVVSVAGTAITLNVPALGTYAAAHLVFSNVIDVEDAYGNTTPIGFTRPTPVLVYVTVALVTDTYRVPGDPASGVNPRSRFQPGSMYTIQSDLLAIGSVVEPGGTIVGKGTNGLVGAFNDVPGIVDYTLSFGLSPTPSDDAPILLQPDQAPIFQLGNIGVSFT